MNTLKTIFLMVLLTLVLVWAGGALGGRGGALIALVFAGVMNFVSYWFSDKIVVQMYRGQEVDSGALYDVVREICQRNNLPMPKVYILPQAAPNAFATGRNPKHAVVAATEGILRILSREELMGVMAHEMSHVGNRDILIGSIAATIAGAISYLAHMAQWAAIFGGFGGRDDEDQQSHRPDRHDDPRPTGGDAGADGDLAIPRIRGRPRRRPAHRQPLPSGQCPAQAGDGQPADPDAAGQ